MDIVLDEGIENRATESKDSNDWFAQLQEALKEGLLLPKEIDSLLEDPYGFLIKYTNSVPVATAIHGQIVRSFFVSSLEMKEKSENTRDVLTKQALDTLSDRMADTDSISAVDLSIIYKNINKET